MRELFENEHPLGLYERRGEHRVGCQVNCRNIPMRPVITQPIVGVMLKRWVTVPASKSLSCMKIQLNLGWHGRAKWGNAHGNFLLCNDYGGIFAPHCNCGMPRAGNRFERIFCPNSSEHRHNILPTARQNLNAYAPTWYSRPSGENTVRYLAI